MRVGIQEYRQKEAFADRIIAFWRTVAGLDIIYRLDAQVYCY
jgi:hypothetical protein